MNTIEVKKQINEKQDMVSSIVNRMTSAPASLLDRLDEQVQKLEKQIEDLVLQLA